MQLKVNANDKKYSVDYEIEPVGSAGHNPSDVYKNRQAVPFYTNGVNL